MLSLSALSAFWGKNWWRCSAGLSKQLRPSCSPLEDVQKSILKGEGGMRILVACPVVAAFITRQSGNRAHLCCAAAEAVEVAKEKAAQAVQAVTETASKVGTCTDFPRRWTGFDAFSDSWGIFLCYMWMLNRLCRALLSTTLHPMHGTVTSAGNATAAGGLK